MSPEERIKRREALKAGGFPKTLTELFERTDLTLDHCAHLCVDNQMKFMDSPAMDEASDKINRYIAPSFNRLGIRTYWVVWPQGDASVPLEVSRLEEKNFMEGAALIRDVWPADIDKVIPKNRPSAFERWPYQDESGPTLAEQILQNDEVDVLLVSGFYADACLQLTARDASDHGYLVVWLEDGTNINEYANKDEMKQRLTDKGIIIMNSEEALADIKKRALAKPAISL